jgi:hypothetical protein
MNRREMTLMSFRKKVTGLLGTLALASALLAALPATTAWASGSSCDGNSLYTCVHVQGTGLYVDEVDGGTVNTTAGTVTGLHIELHGPNGLLKNSPTFSLASLQGSADYTWNHHGNVTGGNYCATLWQLIGSTYYNDGTACLDVHK